MKTVNLEDVCDLIMGQSPDSSTYNEIGVGIPFYQGKADFGEKYPQCRIWCTKPTKYAEKEDILISVRAPIGALNIANETCCIGRGLAAIRPKSLVHNGYLFYFLLSKKEHLASKGTGSTFKAISKNILQSLPVPLLPWSEQEKQASTLEVLENIIHKRRAQLAKLDELVKCRFIELFGDPVYNPNKWEEVPLYAIADVVSGITKGRKIANTQLTEVPYMSVCNVKDGYIEWNNLKTIPATDKEISQYRLLPNDVLMTEGGDPDKVGRGAIIYSPPHNCIHQNHIFRVRLSSQVDSIYFEQYLQHAKAKQYFLRNAKQTTGIASINMSQLKAMPVLIAPPNLQTAFADFVRRIDKSRFVVKEGEKAVKTLKRLGLGVNEIDRAGKIW